MLVLHGLLGRSFEQKELVVKICDKISEGATFRLDKYMLKTRFKGIISSLRYMDKKYVEYYNGLFHMRQME